MKAKRISNLLSCFRRKLITLSKKIIKTVTVETWAVQPGTEYTPVTTSSVVT